MKTETVKYGGIGSDAVKNKTGKDWQAWFKILDKEKANQLPHKEIAALLYSKYKLPAWWAQMITVGFEQARGLRVKNQNSSGQFSAGVSKTFSVKATELYRLIADETERQKWLKGKPEIRTATKDKNLRANFSKKTANLEFALFKKAEGKTQLVITETKLKDKQAVEKQKVYWKTALQKLEALLS
ncbi:MAG: DUF4287 domain-containing protein [Chitinophagales bacterium]